MDRSYAATESERPPSDGVVVEPPIRTEEPVQMNETGTVKTNGASGLAIEHDGAPRKSGSELFLLSTFILGLIAWLVVIVSQAVVAATISNTPVRILWFGLIIQTILTALVVHVLSNSSVYNAAYAYGTQISIFSALSTVFAVIGVDQNIYSSKSAQQAVGAGWLLVAIVDLLWIIFFTSPPQSPLVLFATSIYHSSSRAKQPQEDHHPVEKISRSTDAFHRSHFHGGAAAVERDELEGLTPEEREKVERMVDEKMAAMGMYPRGFQPRDSTSTKPRSEGSKLKSKRKSPGGLWSAHTPPPGGAGARETVTSMSSDHHKSALLEARDGSVLGSGMVGSARPDSGSAAPEDVEPPVPAPPTTPDSAAKWRAEALFEYKGSTEDPNELTFKKGDKLLIFDKSGKWWEAKTPDGRRGIAPSNYLRLL